MANSRVQPVRTGTFDPAVQPQNLGHLDAPVAQSGSALAAAGAKLAEQWSGIADRAAASEGEAAGRVAGLDPAYKPSEGGDWTIRGRAFERAATETYMDRLEAELRRRMTEAYDGYDPAAGHTPSQLAGAFEKIRTDMAGDVAPQVRGRFDALGSRLGTAYGSQATQRYVDKVKDDRRAALDAGIDAGRTTAARIVAGRPGDPKAVEAAGKEIGDQLAAIDRGVKSGDISATSGEKMKQSLRNGAMTTMMEARIMTMSPDDLVAEREKFRADFAGGRLPMIDDVTFARLDNVFLQTLRAQRTAAHAQVGAINKGADDLLTNAEAGMMPSAGALGIVKAQAAGNPETSTLPDTLDRRLAIIDLGRTHGSEGLHALEADLRAKIGATPSPAQADDLRWLSGFIDRFEDRKVRDPVGHNDMIGAIKAPHIDMNGGGADLGKAISERIIAVEAGAKVSGVPAVYLRPEERRTLAARVGKGGDEALAAVSGIIQGAGPRAPAVLAEIGKDAPEFAHAAYVGLATGDDRFARQVAAGLAARQVPGSTPARPGDKLMADVFNDEMGAALTGMDSADQERTKAAAMLWAERELERRQVAPGDVRNDAAVRGVLREALQRSRGMTGQGKDTFGGVAPVEQSGTGWVWNATNRVQVPVNVRTDRFQQVLGAVTSDDLKKLADPPVDRKGETISAYDLMRAVPVAVPGGYRFATLDPGTKMQTLVRAKSGQPFVLPFDELVPTLRRRVPEAFR